MAVELWLEDLLISGQVHRVTVQQPLGAGAQGEVLQVLRKGDPRPWALKLYRVPPEHPDGQHLIHMVEFLRRHGDPQPDLGLALPVTVGVDRDSRRVGILLPFIAGEPLAEGDYRQLYEQGLRSRLWVAAKLAHALAWLHARGIIHGDLAEPNLLVRREGSRIVGLTLIDVDGGGIVAPSGSWRLPPRVLGHADGSLQAPELLRGAQACPNPDTERWALAVILHRLLFGGLDPFFHVAFAIDISDPHTPWPPARPLTPASGQRVLRWHQQTLSDLSDRLRQYFLFAFAPPRSPSLRPAPRDWANALEIAARWVLRCQGCGEELVGERRVRCPNCSVPLPHAWLQSPNRRPLLLWEEGQILTGRDVGLGGTEAREVILRFHRLETGEICVQPVAMSVKPASPRGIRLLPDGTLAFSPGQHRLSILPGKGRLHREIMLEIPL